MVEVVEKDIVDGKEDTAAKERHIMPFILFYININRLIYYETVLPCNNIRRSCFIIDSDR